MSNSRSIDPNLKNKLEGSSGKQFWRSLEELSGSPEFLEYLHREFPEQASEWFDSVSRRNFIKIMSASLALAGLTSCTRQPEERIVPYVRQPEEIIPGKPLFFATAMALGGYANGLLMENHMGRPTKAEGNPDHPASLGSTDVFGQASVLDLYDPDRSQSVTNLLNISSWTDMFQALNLRMQIEKQRPTPGAGLRILTETITSPTLTDQINKLLQALPGAKWHQYEPINRDAAYEGARIAFGRPVDTHYRFDQADVVLSLDSDFFSFIPGHLRYIRDFISRRKVRTGADTSKMNRLYVVESTPSITGAVSDHRLPLRSSHILEFAKAIAAGLGLGGSSDYAGHAWIAPIVRDLQAHKGKCIVIPGEHQPADLHALAHAMNDALGNAGTTVIHTDPVAVRNENHLDSLRQLTKDMASGIVDTLIILGGNPVFTAPADFKFGVALSGVSLRIHLSQFHDETSNLCHWHIPEAHFLESWSDVRAHDGTTTIIQPLIAPLYSGSKSAHEVLAAMTGNPGARSYNIVRSYWQTQNASADFEMFWQKSLHDGVIPNTLAPQQTVTARTDFVALIPPLNKDSDLELLFRPDPSLYDGRFANNGWLQELPRPLTKITWDNPALISPATAKKLGLQNEDIVELQCNNRNLKVPVWIQPGQAEESVTLHLGYGRARSGRVGNKVGFNAYSLRTSNAFWTAPGLQVAKANQKFTIACTQDHHSMEGRDPVHSYSLEEFLAHPPEGQHKVQEHASLYPEYKYEGYAWGMLIDLNSCVGCNACVIACQAENNIPVVGKGEVKRGREMHWIRVDRYFEGDPASPRIHHQPLPCMHCENAPCEVVCPVNATVHDTEGLNEMVYNRCVGTRYCSNNCPYKVRRFNFFLYSDLRTPSLKLMRNPDVTVRTRGVMEKCTYCVQRINLARIDAKREDRKLRDGEVITACAQACPADAIVFGDINDPNSRVAKLKQDQLHYSLLTELNTKPRTTYLANVRNLNPELKNV
jgi:molybdopterin-containing oxidoreductase family iron-sulfur binding subunit